LMVTENTDGMAAVWAGFSTEYPAQLC
jgi:hypothetical protein